MEGYIESSMLGREVSAHNPASRSFYLEGKSWAAALLKSARGRSTLSDSLSTGSYDVLCDRGPVAKFSSGRRSALFVADLPIAERGVMR